MDMITFYNKIGQFAPNPLQQAVWQAYQQANSHPALLVKAGTGAGKTEAVLFPALADTTALRRIILVLPSKALIEDMGERIKQVGQRLSESKIRDIHITVDMGGSCRRYACQNGTVEERHYYRHLFADDIILTTLDKFLFRVFGYGETIKSFIFPHRIFGNALAKKPLIIFDEAHEYEGLAFSNFLKLLEALFIKGQSICVMSATLPEQFVDFLEVVDATQDELGEQQRTFQQAKMTHPEKSLILAPAAANIIAALTEEIEKRYTPSKRIIARTESVKDLYQLYQNLRGLRPLVYHGRMTTAQRNAVIQTLQKRQNENEGFLVLATSAIEAGCDFDAHLIVTELCNPDSLVQLAGRLNRRGTMPGAQLVLIGETIRPHVNVLNKEQLPRYLKDLHAMNGIFRPQGLSPYFIPPQKDWMGEILFDMLWNYVYEGDLTSEPLWKRGILVTRSWEPAITVCTGLDEQGRPQNLIQVGIRKLVSRIRKSPEELKTEQVSNWLSVSLSDQKHEEWHGDIKRSYYHNMGKGEESYHAFAPLEETKGILSCYETTLLCVIHPNYVTQYYDNEFGYVAVPKLFILGYKDGFKHNLDYKPEIHSKTGCFAMNGNTVKRRGRVWYLEG